ncbi:NADH-quinone oxidoreductase subunit C [Cutibacterium acnes]
MTDEKVSGNDSKDVEEPIKKAVTQPVLDRAVAMIEEIVGSDAVDSSYINEINDDLPTLVIKNEHWFSVASMLQNSPELGMQYLRSLTGVDQESHLETVYHLVNLTTKQELCVKVQVDRDHPVIASVTPLWPTADWQEREVYDLLGVQFTGHPNLTRIMMADDWEGHPLRKDYQPLDPEV